MSYGLAVTSPVEEPAAPPESAAAVADTGGFTVRLANFTGPFDLLLQLIGKHKLDVTEVALHQVTDEFIAYIRAMGEDWELDEVSEFLVIAATLLDLKAARLLPSAAVEDQEDLALLEARDLLFARLLQYKAFKEAAAHIMALEAVAARRWPRAVQLEPRYAEALPDLILGIGPERLAALAMRALAPKPPPPGVSIDHLHMVRVSVREHAEMLRMQLVRLRTASFRTLCADCQNTLEVVARFLALLELFRDGLVGFVQEEALGDLTVRWTGADDGGAGGLDVDEYGEDGGTEDAVASAEAPKESASGGPTEEPASGGGAEEAVRGEAGPGGAVEEAARSEAAYDAAAQGQAAHSDVVEEVSGERG
ncbi:MAG: segregation and condensation protein [Micromonosporaceae bacterium]|nr:segregation and condensation protein [Micromonosporaceae bacterium]